MQTLESEPLNCTLIQLPICPTDADDSHSLPVTNAHTGTLSTYRYVGAAHMRGVSLLRTYVAQDRLGARNVALTNQGRQVINCI